MEKSLDTFIPPYLISFPTGTITFAYVGPQSEWQPQQRSTVFRRATNGYLSLYCDLEKEQSHVLAAICFQEDDLPALNRQVYHHYIDKDDAIVGNGNQVEISFSNHPEDHSTVDTYKNTIAWRIRFSKRHIDMVRYILTQARPLTASLPRISALSKEDRDLLYYHLRATLMPQPVPKRLGSLGKWSARTPLGSPQFPSPASDDKSETYHDAQERADDDDNLEEDDEEKTPIAISAREKERERYKNKPPSSPPPRHPSPSPPGNRNSASLPSPFGEDEGFYQSVDATPKKDVFGYAKPKPKPQPPTPTPIRNRKAASEEDAFADSPVVGGPVQMALRKRGGGLSAAVQGGASERKVSMQAMVGSASVVVQFDERDADKVLKAFVPEKKEVGRSEGDDGVDKDGGAHFTV